ncbi:hypothetical protein SS05631_c09370 [Sinorhizobium sp. CCBAU 05631]|nr:hypothetical protein SS05631_c09370 [Sinorhizobium sp. CCBAU 05631]
MSHASLLPQPARRGKNRGPPRCGERASGTCLNLELQPWISAGNFPESMIRGEHPPCDSAI